MTRGGHTIAALALAHLPKTWHLVEEAYSVPSAADL
jgi:hypothetical protein